MTTTPQLAETLTGVAEATDHERGETALVWPTPPRR